MPECVPMVLVEDGREEREVLARLKGDGDDEDIVDVDVDVDA